jgi:uncharacterized LabA/DUF88 family protein
MAAIHHTRRIAPVSKNVAVFVDVANLYYAARGQDVDVDYVALLKHATKGRDLIRAYAYSGLDPENENQKKFLDFLSKNGYRVVAKDIRKFGDGRVKANLDIELVVDLFRLADRMDVAVIVSGDGDFAPAIRALQDEGVRCEVISFKPNTSSDLFAVADEFVDVMKIIAIGREKGAKGVGAPEMPAKEVNPDVGFREASPAVAAAALAAARGNGDEPPARGRGRGTGRRADSGGRSGRGRSRTADEAPAPTPTPAPASRADDDVSSADGRRRRRRGGRGRGRRGRRGLSETADVEVGGQPGEIQWSEVDSLAELDAEDGLRPVAEGEIAFEEADAATLAELGLTAQPPAVAVEAAEAEADVPSEEAAAPKRRSRATTAKPATASTAARKTGSRTAAAKAGTKSTTKTTAKSRAAAPKDEEPAESAASTAAAAAKPRRPRTTKTSAKAGGTKATAKADAGKTESPAADGADQGIWQRFTSGRGSRKRPGAEPPTES